MGRLCVRFSRITKEGRRKGAEERLGREQERRCLSPCRDAVTKCPEMINQEKKDLGSLAVQGTAPRGREGKALRAHICGQKKRPGGGCTRLIPSPHLHRPGWQQTMPSTLSGPS